MKISQQLPSDVVIANPLTLCYVPLETARKWDDNPKLHAMALIKASIRRHGYKDPGKFEPTLNDGAGGLVEGNGRAGCLEEMYSDGEPAPGGIGVDAEGKWWVPVLFGVDAASQAEAAAYGIDHNWLTVSPLGAEQTAGIWSPAIMKALAEKHGPGWQPVSTSGADLVALMTAQEEENAGAAGYEKSTGDNTTKLRLTMAEPETQVENGEIYHIDDRHILVIADVVTEVEAWYNFLELGRTRSADLRLFFLFCPYPDPFVTLGIRAEESLMLLIQPDPFIAGHLLDQAKRIRGEESVVRLRAAA